jgi:hypothetical protein
LPAVIKGPALERVKTPPVSEAVPGVETEPMSVLNQPGGRAACSEAVAQRKRQERERRREAKVMEVSLVELQR